jgi:hypothetical protein
MFCRRALLLSCLVILVSSAFASGLLFSGRVVDPSGVPIPGATVRVSHVGGREIHLVATAPDGSFQIPISQAGAYQVRVEAPQFQPLQEHEEIHSDLTGQQFAMTPMLTRKETVTVTSDVNEIDILSPDPAEKVFVRQDLLDANPGRPGAPVSIPGYPIETASSGITAPQYFAPGVAGDHGEPIAQFIALGFTMCRIIFRRMRMAMGMPTQTSSFQK